VNQSSFCVCRRRTSTRKARSSECHQFMHSLFVQSAAYQRVAQDPSQHLASRTHETTCNSKPTIDEGQLSLPSELQNSSGQPLSDPFLYRSRERFEILTTNTKDISDNAAFEAAGMPPQEVLSGIHSVPPGAQLYNRHSAPAPQGMQFQRMQQRGSGGSALVVDAFDMAPQDHSLLPPPPTNASISSLVDFLHWQLDSFGTNAEIMPGLLLMGNGDDERLRGGAPVARDSGDSASTVPVVCLHDVQYSLVYPATFVPSFLGRINARTGLSISP
jgi:hypothetical protein